MPCSINLRRCLQTFFIALTVIIAFLFVAEQTIQNRFDQLYERLYGLTFANDALTEDCAQNLGQQQIYQDVANLRNALGDFINQAYLAGHLLSPPTFCKLYAFARWNSDLQAKDLAVCHSNFKSDKDFAAWKHGLLAAINADNVQQRNFTAILTDPLQANVSAKYTVAMCTK